MITQFDQLDLTKSYTYKDYLSWRFPERVELILGKIFKMSPAPSRYHQKVSRRLFRFIDQYYIEEQCELYSAPFDVVLLKGEKSTVVQPDLCVVCDKSKLTKQGCEGAPNLIVEILSPGNTRREMKEKFELYEKNGVQEYWMVDLGNKSIIVYTYNEKKKYVGSKPFVEGEKVESQILKGLKMDVADVFKE